MRAAPDTVTARCRSRHQWRRVWQRPAAATAAGRVALWAGMVEGVGVVTAVLGQVESGVQRLEVEGARVRDGGGLATVFEGPRTLVSRIRSALPYRVNSR